MELNEPRHQIACAQRSPCVPRRNGIPVDLDSAAAHVIGMTAI